MHRGRCFIPKKKTHTPPPNQVVAKTPKNAVYPIPPKPLENMHTGNQIANPYVTSLHPHHLTVLAPQ